MPPAHAPKKKSHKKLWIGLIVAVIVLVIIISAMSHGGTPTPAPTTQATQAPTQASQPTAQPTLAPTPTAQPTSAPTKAPTIGSQVVVGGTEDAFTAKFGNPTSQQTQNGAQELDYATGDATIGQFGIVLWPDTRTVYGLVIAAPTGQPWDAITAIPLCINYLPGDVTLDQPKNITDTAGNVVGLFQSGYSTELANTLNPAYFNDAIGNNLVKPGTFSIRYTYTDSSGTASNLCTIRLGMQSTSA